MAHELDFSNGQAAIALRGGATTAWHGLGQTIEPGDSLPVIQRKAGLAWQALTANMQFETTDGSLREVPNRQILYRSDTFAPLGEVSNNRYKVVQPSEVMEFFNNFVTGNDMQIETAGSLRGGRIVWCLAKMSDDFQMTMGHQDVISSYIRLQTSFDCSMATSLVGTTIRQVCANTMRMIERDTERSQYRTPHSVQFDTRALQRAFGLVGEQFKVTAELYNQLIKRKVTNKESTDFFQKLFDIKPGEIDNTDKNTETVLSTYKKNQLAQLAAAYTNGPGADFSTAKDTAFGLLNAVTYWADHKAPARDTYGDGSAAARLNSAWFGVNNDMKLAAQQYAAELAGCSELIAA